MDQSAGISVSSVEDSFSDCAVVSLPVEEGASVVEALPEDEPEDDPEEDPEDEPEEEPEDEPEEDPEEDPEDEPEDEPEEALLVVCALFVVVV